MCGISGVIVKNNSSNSFELLKTINNSIIHRGPDDEGLYKSKKGNISLGMRRLSIIDDKGGRQPMISEDERFVLVFNGEIINSIELRKNLEAKGVRFRSSHSDTEVLFNLLIEEGVSCLSKLNGMFSFLFFDSKKNVLISCRDRLGIKPLYIYNDNKNIFFCSELKGILKVLDQKLTLNKQAAFNFFSLMYLPDHNSIYNEVKKQKPGSYILFNLNENTLREDFFFKFNFKKNEIHKSEIQNKLNDILIRSINRWSLSDHTISTSLSGGLDSSLISLYMNNINDKPINTFTLGFEIKDRFDETANAKKLSHQLNSKHKEVILTPAELIDELDDIAKCMEEPYGGGVPSWLLFKHISMDHKVVFTGTGADEIFGSYGKWRRLQILKYFTKDKFVSNKEFEKYFFERGFDGKGYYFSDIEKRKYILSDPQELIKTSDYLYSIFKEIKTDNLIDKFSCLDMKTQLPNEFLNMTDKFSMHFSLECRPPLLDNELIDFFMQTPSNQRTSFFNYKFLLKKILKNKIPDEIVNGPKKGFEIPIKNWIKNDLRSLIGDFFSSDFLRKQSFFDPIIKNTLIDPYLNNPEAKINDTKIWGLLMFQIWYFNSNAS